MNKLAQFTEYNPNYPALFEAERDRLANALDGIALDIHHVGSTSVPHMPGKSIIDILVTVTALEPKDSYAAPLEGLGYINRPVPERPESPFFTRPAIKPRSHNVHIAVSGSKREASMLAFRDYLRTNSQAFSRYEKVKRDIVSRNPDEWAFYSKMKASVATEIEKEAIEFCIKNGS